MVHFGYSCLKIAAFIWIINIASGRACAPGGRKMGHNVIIAQFAISINKGLFV
jgi:hypothetical protein